MKQRRPSKDEDKCIDIDVILALNLTGPDLPIDPARAEQLAQELARLRAAAESARRRVDFDIDPFDFRLALIQSSNGRQ
jgi:hypothetical protein